MVLMFDRGLGFAHQPGSVSHNQLTRWRSWRLDNFASLIPQKKSVSDEACRSVFDSNFTLHHCSSGMPVLLLLSLVRVVAIWVLGPATTGIAWNAAGDTIVAMTLLIYSTERKAGRFALTRVAVGFIEFPRRILVAGR